MPIPDHLVEDIRQRADIVEILSEHTRLRRTGKTYRGPCPLHGGEGPNFSVDPAKGFYKCFTCGEGGTVYSFLMKHLGMTYPEAIRWVAERVGVEIPDEREERRAQAEDPNRLLYEINGFAAKWFRDQLASPDGAEARDYLKRRGITPETIERFGLGWAPESFDALGTAARKAGYHGADLLALGLLKEPKKAGRDPYDAFRGRVMFPIEDLGGRVLGFGGRVLQQVEAHIPKYLNSPESEIYHKGSTLYGLGWSRGSIRKEEVALVVEGYMDYVSLAAHGVTHAVAPLGTAMTEEQAALIKQYAPRAILLYDSDKAGLKAAFRNGDQLLRAGVEVLVATLPEGEDPDSLVRAQGADALRRYLDDAVDVLERKLLLLDRKNYFGSIKGTRRAIDLLLPTVRATRDEVLKGVYLKRISDRTGVPVDVLTREAAEVVDAPTRREMRVQQRQERQGGRDEGRGEERGEGRRGRQQWHGSSRGGERQGSRWNADRPLPTPALRLRMGAERNLLMMMFHSERWVEECAKFVGPDDFQDPDYRRLFRVLIETEGRRDAEGRWLLEFPEELAGDVETVRGDAEHYDWSGAPVFFAENMDRILARPLEREAREIKHRAQAGGEVDPDMLAELQQQLLLKRENRNLKVRPGILDPDDPILRRDRERR
ncbi:MAG: DNA primase [Gemmatimonadetes bacterium]|nr:DNA primase [Gemmatimonadota bacterium]